MLPFIFESSVLVFIFFFNLVLCFASYLLLEILLLLVFWDSTFSLVLLFLIVVIFRYNDRRGWNCGGGWGGAGGTGGKGRLNKNRIISASNKNYKDYKTGNSISRRLRRAT